jgi:hypothetical protein
MTTQDIWEARWQQLQLMIDKRVELLKASNIDRWKDFVEMLEDLKAFAQCQFTYFHTKLDKPSPTLEYSHKFALTITLNQVGYDLQLISLAAEQRREHLLAKSLRAADRIAEIALEPAIKGPEPLVPKAPGGDRPRSLICYYQKSPWARRQPYSRIGLIGIPPTCVLPKDDANATTTLRDFLAIPHEVGHYVFWNGQRKTDASARKPKPKYFSTFQGYEVLKRGVTPYMAYWTEEIFADTYGARIAGPLIASSFQDILAAQTMDGYYLKNIRYFPAPIIRAEIYLYALRRLKRGSNDKTLLVSTLTGRWQDLAKNSFRKQSDDAEDSNPSGKLKTEPVATFTTYERHEQSIASASRELKTVCGYVNSFLDDIHPPQFFLDLTKPNSKGRVTNNPNGDNQLHSGFDELDKAIKNLVEPSNLNQSRNQQSLQRPSPWAATECDNETTTWYKWKEDLVADERKLPPKYFGYVDKNQIEWFSVMYAGGWTVDSPAGGTGPRKG